jgi:hypothetical protein
VFCFPLLGIKNSANHLLKGTYLAWDGEYNVEDLKLICQVEEHQRRMFYLDLDNVFESNPMFERKIDISSTNSVYVFDFSNYLNDWLLFVDGKYSMLSIEYKRMVILRFAKNPRQATVIRKILYPSKHYHEFAKIVDVPVSVVREVGEVLDPPDLHKEKLILENKIISSVSKCI